MLVANLVFDARLVFVTRHQARAIQCLLHATKLVFSWAVAHDDGSGFGGR
jgi:hypothetical protein